MSSSILKEVVPNIKNSNSLGNKKKNNSDVRLLNVYLVNIINTSAKSQKQHILFIFPDFPIQ